MFDLVNRDSMKISPVTVFYMRNLFDAFNSGLIFTSIYAFYVREIGMSPFQLLLIGTVIMATGFLFETPTGVVADLYSRKLSVIIGGVLIGVCFILTGSIPLYSVALIAALIEAIGDTFVSGALDAWISDEVGAERVGQLWLRAAQLGTPAHWLGIGASILLATSSTDCLGRRVVAGCQSAAVVGDARNGLCPPADPALPRKVFAASAVAKRA